MILFSVKLSNFRGYAEKEFSFGNRVNLISGKNGSGKTNLLEAIHYLCLSKGYFFGADANNLHHGQNFFRIAGKFNSGSKEETITVVQPRGGRKTLSRNEVPYAKIAEHVGLIPVVAIAPADTEIISGGSEPRRRMLDSMLSQTSHEYLNTLILHNKLLQHRNALLVQFAEAGKTDSVLLDTINEKLFSPSLKLFEKRKSAVNEIVPLVRFYYEKISEGKEKAEVIYRSDLEGNSPADVFSQNLQRDLAMQRTTGGIHRDDLILELDKTSASKFASQGLQKSFLIALKFAEFAFLANHCIDNRNVEATTPMLLLDDIFDKLDQQRIDNLNAIVSQKPFQQVMITDARPDRYLTSVNSLVNEIKLGELNS